jgi:hypothetical protein
MSDMPSSAAIDIHLKFFPLAFILYLLKPRLEIDGSPPMTASWGTARFPVTPGQHRVRAYVPYLFFRFMGDATVVVDVGPGQVVLATWSAPWLAFLPGKWKLSAGQQGSGVLPPAQARVGAVVAAPAQAAAWHPDPTHRHQLRYWDGSTWTAHVSDNGVAATDAIG